jgi:HAMP domain-containing protein
MSEAISMKTVATVKRPRGRPRADAPPRSDVHARLEPTLKARLERDAKRAHRSVGKEFEIRLEKSYLNDEMYGGPQMAAMFREMAEVALGYVKYKNRGSFFEDFEIFVFVRDVWKNIIQRQMPRPDEELLAEVYRGWDAVKAGSPQRAAERAAREWLIDHTASQLTLAQMLAGAFEPAIGRHAKPHGAPSDKLAETAESTAASDIDIPPNPPDSLGPESSVSAAPSIGSLGKAVERLIQSDGNARAALPATANCPIGSLAKVMEGLIPSTGSVRAAAGEVSRLAELLAEATEEPASTAAAAPSIGHGTDVVTVLK